MLNNFFVLLRLQNSDQEKEAKGNRKLGESKNGKNLSSFCLAYVDI